MIFNQPSFLFFSVPGPPSLWVRPGTGPSVVVRWAPPLECSDSDSNSGGAPVEIQGYRLQFGLKNTSLDSTVDFTNRERNFTVRNLSPGSSYVFVLAARSPAGYGDVVEQEITVPLFPPLGYPKISDYVNATCCSLHLSWLPLAAEESNGVITEYTVAYKEVAGPKSSADPGPSTSPAPPAPPWLVTLPASESSYTILGLNHSTVYMVQLRAHNKAGPGPFCPPLLSQTLAFETGRAGLRTDLHPLSTGSASHLSPLEHSTKSLKASSCRAAFHLREAENCTVPGNATTPPIPLRITHFIPPSPPLHHQREQAEC